MKDELNEYIEEVSNSSNSATILVENVWIMNARNVYHARFMNQRHYNGETNSLQIDSHH